MTNVASVVFYVLGSLVVGAAWTAFAYIRMQDKSKLWIVWLLCALSMLFALLSGCGNRIVFGSLALVFPTLVLLGLGTLLVLLAAVQGMHAVSVWILAAVLGALMAFGSAIVMVAKP